MTLQNLPPGPPPVKNVLELFRLTQKLGKDSLGAFADWSRTYGDVFAINIMKMHQFIVTNPEYIHQILVTDAAKFIKDAGYKDPQRGLARFLGNGLLNSDGEFWKRQRRLVAPALHVRRIEAYAQTMVDYTLAMLDSWRDGARLDISHEMSGLTMKIVARTLFNADVTDEVDRVYQTMAVIQQAAGDMSLLPA